MTRLDLGCGKNKKEGFTGVDSRRFEGVDVVCNPGVDPWPWENSSVEEVHYSHMLEHLTPKERIHFANELHRVMNGSDLYLTNTVFSGNHVTSFRQGGAIFNNNSSNAAHPVVQIKNCIIWDNAIAGNYTYFNLTGAGQSGINVSYTIIGPANLTYPGNAVSPGTGTFNDLGNNKIGVDPLFINAPAGSAAPTTNGDFHVQPGSPAIDMGLSSANTDPSDLDQNIRILGSSIDIGAYESPGPNCAVLAGLTAVYVDSAATGANNGSSWANAFTDLQDALAALYTVQ